MSDETRPIKQPENRYERIGANGISVFEAKMQALDLTINQRSLELDRVNMGVSFMAVCLSFIFLFEATFVGSIFPEHMGSLAQRIVYYIPALSLLIAANFFLLTSLALLMVAGVTRNKVGANMKLVRGEDFTGEKLLGYKRSYCRTLEVLGELVANQVRSARGLALLGLVAAICSVIAFTYCGTWWEFLFGAAFVPRDPSLVEILFWMAIPVLAGAFGILTFYCYYRYRADVRWDSHFEHCFYCKSTECTDDCKAPLPPRMLLRNMPAYAFKKLFTRSSEKGPGADRE